MTSWEDMDKERFMKEIVIPRAQEYINQNDPQQAYASVQSDMRKNRECREYINSEAMGIVGVATMFGGLSEHDVIKFVNGMYFVKEEWGLKPMEVMTRRRLFDRLLDEHYEDGGF